LTVRHNDNFLTFFLIGCSNRRILFSSADLFCLLFLLIQNLPHEKKNVWKCNIQILGSLRQTFSKKHFKQFKRISGKYNEMILSRSFEFIKFRFEKVLSLKAYYQNIHSFEIFLEKYF